MVMKVRRGIVFTTMVVLLFIALAFVLCMMIITSNPSKIIHQANYTGAMKLVLLITGYEGGHYNVTVLNTNDTSIPTRDNCWLFISQPIIEDWWTEFLAPSQLTTGTIIGVNDYEFSNNIAALNNNKTYYLPDQIQVTVPNGTDWTAKIKIIGVYGLSSVTI